MTTLDRARKTTVTVVSRARFAVLAILLALTGCQHAEEEPAPTGPPPPVVRHDTEELVRTFPALGAPVSASWIRWDNSGGEPSKLQLTWIDAVVKVTPETMNELVTKHEPEDSGRHPAVQKVLEPELPPGPFLTGVVLNMAFDAVRRSSRVFLDPQHDSVVIQSSLAG